MTKSLGNPSKKRKNEEIPVRTERQGNPSAESESGGILAVPTVTVFNNSTESGNILTNLWNCNRWSFVLKIDNLCRDGSLTEGTDKRNKFT